MKKLTKALRRAMLLLLIVLASVLPVPIIFYTRDKTPKFVVERVEERDEEEFNDVLEIK
jgi:hypothetical protein